MNHNFISVVGAYYKELIKALLLSPKGNVLMEKEANISLDYYEIHTNLEISLLFACICLLILLAIYA